MSRVCAPVFALAAISCGGGYLDGSTGELTKDFSAQKQTPIPALPRPALVPLMAHFARPRPVHAPAPDAGEPGRSAHELMDAMVAMDAMVTSAPQIKPEASVREPQGTVRIASSENLDAYLTDALGRTLYMYVRDVPGSPDSACLGDCARQWPPFDTAVFQVDPPLQAAELTRFHRQDGAFQTAYKGHPLYYRASEQGTRAVSADGLDLRWFVARDYLLFMGAATSFAPLKGSAGDGMYLTDGFGRALYVCLDDTPAASSCSGDCIADRPVFDAAQTDRTTRLPSVLSATDLNELVRPDGLQQLTYRGWPLYYFSGDLPASAPQGHNQTAWRALDPIQLGNAQPDLPEP